MSGTSSSREDVAQAFERAAEDVASKLKEVTALLTQARDQDTEHLRNAVDTALDMLDDVTALAAVQTALSLQRKVR